jgi:hypothetical protein
MINNKDDYEDDCEKEEEDDFNKFPPKPTALFPRLDSISGGVDNSFSADNEQELGASAQGGTCSADADDEQGRKSGHQGGSCPGGGKWKEGSVTRGRQKKGHALTQPFKTPQKSQDSDNNDDDNRFTFQNMMSMMMYLSRVESDQWERQSKIEAEQREREHQLCREEMAIARKDARAQRQLMNMMMMSMLNRNRGGGGQ